MKTSRNPHKNRFLAAALASLLAWAWAGAAAWPGNAAAQAPEPVAIGSLEGDGPPQGIRFLVEDDGLFYLDAAFLEAAGLSLPLPTRNLRLMDRHGEVPLWIEDGGDGRIEAGSDDRLLFYGFYPRGKASTRPIFNTGSPHWLLVDAQAANRELRRRTGRPKSSKPRRYETLGGRDARRRVPRAFRGKAHFPTQRFERDYFYATWIGADQEATDFYFYESVGTTRPEAVFDNLWLDKPLDPSGDPNVANLKPLVRVKLYGVSRAQYPDKPDHAAEVWVNGHLAGSAEWNGMEPLEWEAEFDFAWLAPGAQTVKLVSPEDRALMVDEIYIDWLEIAIPASLDYSPASRLPYKKFFTGDWKLGPRDRGVQIPSNSWKSEDATLIDPTNAILWKPVVTTPEGADGAGNQYFRHEWLALQPLPEPALGGEIPPLVGFAPEHAKPLDPAKARPWREQPALRSPAALAGRPRNLMIAHGSLWPEAKRLAAWRESQGVETLLVDVQDLYDAYSEGMVSHEAVHDFVQALFQASPKSELSEEEKAAAIPNDTFEPRRLRYLTLFGDSTFDYKGVQEASHPERKISGLNLLPIFYTDTFQARRANRSMFPADNNFVAFLETPNTPALAVGRIPAATLPEARAVVDKIIAYESAPAGEEWVHRTALVSSWERSFQNLLDELAGDSLKDFENEFLVAQLDSYEDDVAKLEGALDQGCGLLYYVGHGGSFVWRVGPVDFEQQKDLFTTENIRGLSNEGRYPIVLVSSCYTVSFDHSRSLGEEFLLSDKRGAVAVVGSPWKTGVSPNHQFNLRLSEYLFSPEKRAGMFPPPSDPGAPRLGDAFLAAKHHRTVGSQSRMDFTMLGDPCLRANVPPAREEASAEAPE